MFLKAERVDFEKRNNGFSIRVVLEHIRRSTGPRRATGCTGAPAPLAAPASQTANQQVRRASALIWLKLDTLRCHCPEHHSVLTCPPQPWHCFCNASAQYRRRSSLSARLTKELRETKELRDETRGWHKRQATRSCAQSGACWATRHTCLPRSTSNNTIPSAHASLG